MVDMAKIAREADGSGPSLVGHYSARDGDIALICPARECGAEVFARGEVLQGYCICPCGHGFLELLGENGCLNLVYVATKADFLREIEKIRVSELKKRFLN